MNLLLGLPLYAAERLQIAFMPVNLKALCA